MVLDRRLGTAYIRIACTVDRHAATRGSRVVFSRRHPFDRGTAASVAALSAIRPAGETVACQVVPVMNTVRTEKVAAPAGQGATTKE
jgi:hypothetical protein